MIKILIDFSFFNGNFFDSNISIGNINRVDIQNIVVDEIKIDRGSSTIYNTQKTNWNETTILQGKFQNSDFELGNVILNGMPVEALRIKKKRDGETTWNKYIDIPFDVDQTNYSWSDLFVEALVSYQYSICPLGSNGIEGEYGIETVDCDYENIFILGANSQQYRLFANIQKGDITAVVPTNYVETLGNQYPYQINNGSVNYRKGTVRATLISDSTLDGNSGINRKAEKVLKDNLYSFLTDKQPKIYKDSDGDYILISINPSSVKITPNNDLSRQICDVSYDFVEIGNSNSVDDLRNNALLE